MPCKHFYISGRVQGVFFRASTCETARALKLAGWVKNTLDGRVEVFACGNVEQLAKLKVWLEKGPPMASVEHVEVIVMDAMEVLDGFEIRY